MREIAVRDRKSEIECVDWGVRKREVGRGR
jgi:hypothetical protein